MSLERAVEAAVKACRNRPIRDREYTEEEYLRLAVGSAAPYIAHCSGCRCPWQEQAETEGKFWRTRWSEQNERAERAEAEVGRLQEALNEQAQRWASEVERVIDRNPQPTDGRGDG